MCESTECGYQRTGWRVAVKRSIVRLFSAALVGGQHTADYAAGLGMPRDRILPGYDAVDNQYFSSSAEEAAKRQAETRNRLGLLQNYFLASARFVETKTLPRLLQAFGRYRLLARDNAPQAGDGQRWCLVLLGDGPLKADIRGLVSCLSVEDCVIMPGWKQYDELPAYCGLPGAFIHASTTEQWGLVVDEAMASGLPVLVSNRCGCASDVVREGVNGFTFDPLDVKRLAKLMLRIASMDEAARGMMGRESQRIIADRATERFASGLEHAAEEAVRLPRPPAAAFDRVVLRLSAQRS
jgi:glycosyltransferase involved in cell wall biosynthesis